MSLDPKLNSNQSTPQQSHTKAAEHCDAASTSHKEAAKHYAYGDAKQGGMHAQAAQGHTMKANEHSAIAIKNMAHSNSVKK